MCRRPSSSVTRYSSVSCGARAGCWSSKLIAARAISEMLPTPCVKHRSRNFSYSSAVRRKLIILLLDSIMTGGFVSELNCGDPFTVDLDRDRALQHGHRDHDSPVALFFQENAFQPFQGAAPDANTLAFAQERARLSDEAGSQNGPHRIDFRLGDGRRLIAETHDGDNTRGADDRKPFPGVEPAEDIAGEQGAVRFDDAIGPALPVPVDRQVLLISFAL